MISNRYAIQLCFKGTRYHGWQVQANAQTVQGEVDLRLSRLFNRQIETIGCGRTDTGVHSSSFIAHFDAPEIYTPAELLFKLSRMMPSDIAVLDIKAVSNDFHARFDALSRTYHYFISHKPSPFLNDYVWVNHLQPNIDEMNIAAAMLLNTSDFASFAKNNSQTKTTLCSIYEAQWFYLNNLLVFQITANRFLRNMVRALVGTLMDVGTQRITISDLEDILQSKSRSKASESVPPQGLFLSEVIYPSSSISFQSPELFLLK